LEILLENWNSYAIKHKSSGDWVVLCPYELSVIVSLRETFESQ
jgi:hypothetical protein